MVDHTMVTGGSPKINILAFRGLQSDNKVLFKPCKIIERTILYKTRGPRALYDVFWPNYISITESSRDFFRSIPLPPPPQQTTVKLKSAFDRSVHTFSILEAPILYSNGCFISSSPGTAMGGKGLIWI